MHREQSIGEVRGLKRLSIMITDRKFELEEKLGLHKKPDPEVTQ